MCKKNSLVLTRLFLLKYKLDKTLYKSNNATVIRLPQTPHLTHILGIEPSSNKWGVHCGRILTLVRNRHGDKHAVSL